MFRRKPDRHRTDLAIRLTRIAVCLVSCGLLCSPDAGRTAEPTLECARKCFRRAETHRQRHIQNRQAWLCCQPHGRHFNTPTTHIVAQCLAHPRSEEPMEMKGGEVRDFGQGAQVERLIQMLVDVCDHSMHSVFVLRAAVSRNHAAPKVGLEPRRRRCGDDGRAAPHPRDRKGTRPARDPRRRLLEAGRCRASREPVGLELSRNRRHQQMRVELPAGVDHVPSRIARALMQLAVPHAFERVDVAALHDHLDLLAGAE